MIDAISGATTQALVLALDAAGLRHQAIANNIANANTPGYIPLRVNFEEQLSAFRDVQNGTDNQVRDSLRGVQGFIEQDMAASGSGAANVMLDMEVVKLNQNVVHYETLLRGLNKQMSILSMAINEGKR